MIAAKVTLLQGAGQSVEDAAQSKLDEAEQYEIDLKTQAEARQYILFQLGGSPSGRGATLARDSRSRPSSAPPGFAVKRPLSPLDVGRPPSAASVPARPGSAMRNRQPQPQPRPLSASSGGVLRVPSRPCSANSMTARMKALQENVARNKRT